ncbi:MAG: acyl-CoA dehydrogenase [Candidatus Promineifilaceae bacterium]|jgi:acyl-CoA dehydrogenase
MINFNVPDDVKQRTQMVDMLAKQVMRPISRKYDEAEHERPTEYFDAMWPITKMLYAGQVAKLEKIVASGTNGPEKKKRSGPNTSFLGTILAIEALSWGDAGIYLCTPNGGLGGAAIEAVGTPEQKLRLLKKWTEGEPKWGAMAITEPMAGSDNSSMRTTAILDEQTNEWVLNGEKVFITNGSLSLKESDGLCIVWATIDPEAGRAGIKSFIVEAHNPGVTVAKQEHKLGIRASDTVALHFKDARIPYDNLLGNPEVIKRDGGFKGAMKTFDASRPAVAASAVGIARAALEFTQETLKAEGIEVDYTKPKNQLTAIERDLLEMEARWKGSWLLTLKATSQMCFGESNRREASMCKYRAGEAVTWITQKSVDLLGPLGYSREMLAEKWMRDAKINDIYEGTKQINLLIIARDVLGYSRRELA